MSDKVIRADAGPSEGGQLSVRSRRPCCGEIILRLHRGQRWALPNSVTSRSAYTQLASPTEMRRRCSSGAASVQSIPTRQTDAVLVSILTDAATLSVSSHKDKREQFTRTRESLEVVGVQTLGALLNLASAHPRKQDMYYHYPRRVPIPSDGNRRFSTVPAPTNSSLKPFEGRTNDNPMSAPHQGTPGRGFLFSLHGPQ